MSLAIGLIAGKGASFVSARISYPLSQRFGPHAPFVLATLLALFSFGVNLIYLASSSWLAQGAGVRLEPGEEPEKELPGARITAREAVQHVAEKRVVRLKDMARFGDVFWLYLGINVLCGAIWSPFTHLASYVPRCATRIFLLTRIPGILSNNAMNYRKQKPASRHLYYLQVA